MRKTRLLAIVAVIAVLTALVAAPASAKKPVYGDQTIVLNMPEGPPGTPFLYGCNPVPGEYPGISWFGEITVEGHTYGMSLHPDPATRLVGSNPMMLYVEGWTIWTEAFEVKNGVIEECEPGDVVMAGTDHGVANMDMDSGRFHSTGVVEYVTTTPIPDWEDLADWMNRRVFQSGTVGLVAFGGLEDVLGFYGLFRLD